MRQEELYSLDKARWPTPWAFWWRRKAGGTWQPCQTHPTFNPSVEFERRDIPHTDPMKYKKREPWTARDNYLLRKHWPSEIVYELFPKRTRENIDKHARKLRLRSK